MNDNHIDIDENSNIIKDPETYNSQLKTALNYSDFNNLNNIDHNIDKIIANNEYDDHEDILKDPNSTNQ
jgi:hypothetical protein